MTESMRIYGLDFTSAPGRGKPLAMALCRLDARTLVLDGFEAPESYGPLEELLRSPGSWAMGCDFPFSQPARLLREAPGHVLGLEWPVEWERFLRLMGQLSPSEFKTLMKTSPVDGRGVRERKRLAGTAANACSPMHVDFPPVGLMFLAGARLLSSCPCAVVPQRMNGDSRLLFEVYPGVFAERFCGHKSYKEGPKHQQDERAIRRGAMLESMCGRRFQEVYGFTVSFGEDEARRMREDRKGDLLDSLICAVQAAWAWNRRHDNFGMPGPDLVDPDILAFEGWIMDPHCRA